jgi:alpha-L-fucosidase 2
MSDTLQTKAVSGMYTEVIPHSREPRTAGGWRDGMVTGNGEQGVVCSGSPYSETMIFQNMFFIMPTNQPRFTPLEVAGELHEARQAVIHFDDAWNVHGRKRTYLYRFHPAYQLRMTFPVSITQNYTRETDYASAEVSLRYTDENGTWERRTFTSRHDNVTIARIVKSSTGKGVAVDFSIDDFSSMHKFGYDFFSDARDMPEQHMQYQKVAAQDGVFLAVVAHYPSFEGSELQEGGYAGVTKIIAMGGVRELIYGEEIKESIHVSGRRKPVIRIRDANEVILITKTARTHCMGPLNAFAEAQRHPLLDSLVSDVEEVARKYSDDHGFFSYERALAPHRRLQAELFGAVSFSLESGGDRALYNEALIQKQRESKTLLPAMVERAYNQGRYAQICSSGHSTPRLCGLWTGEWNPGWSGAYTMDANVNLQVSGMNTGNVYTAAIGYIYFVLRQIKDWEENADKVYGMKDALLVPVNTDGDVAVMVEYDQYYPFQYWNAGASWMLLPIYEFWQCYGNRKIPVAQEIRHLYQTDELDLEANILYPLLTKQANFWEQICTPEYFTDVHGKARYQKGKQALGLGERYIILPSYSPENQPKDYRSTITANATMDITAARDGLKMAVQMEKTLARDGWRQAVDKWERLMGNLPDYLFDETGAIREWAMREYRENNEHRHISHLYCAWPAYEAHDDPALAAACNTAIANRNRENVGKDDTASHGWVHKTLVAARLKNAESAYALLYTILSSEIYYNSMMTDHNTDRSSGVFCTDTCIGMVGMIDEMLLYSNTGIVEFLPALPRQWAKGAINGLMARTNAKVTGLQWDLAAGKASASVLSFKEQILRISFGLGCGKIRTSKGVVAPNGAEFRFSKDEEIMLEYIQDADCQQLVGQKL